MNSNLSIFNQLRPFTIGFDDVFDHFEKMADYSFQSTSYPPYNIVKTGDFTYDIEVVNKNSPYERSLLRLVQENLEYQAG